MEQWEWFAGLSDLEKPVDYILLPEGSHILTKPYERHVAQQGMVDWFRFWLLGEEDPDPARLSSTDAGAGCASCKRKKTRRMSAASVLVVHDERPVEVHLLRLGALALHDDVVAPRRPNRTQHAESFFGEHSAGILPVGIHNPEIVLALAVGNERNALSIRE